MIRYFCDVCKAEVPPRIEDGFAGEPEKFHVPVWKTSKTRSLEGHEVMAQERGAESRLLCVICQDVIRTLIS